MKDWKIGTDYEIPIAKNGIPVSIVGKIGGTKDEPLSIGNGCARQEDNVNVEITQPPVNNFEEFISYIEYGLTTVAEMIPEYEYSFNSMLIYPDEELNTAEATLFGCESSMNVYKRGMSTPVQSTNPNLRSAGFHIHFGHESIADKDENTDIGTQERLAKLFDKYITLPSILLDPERGRRELYGRAGEIRFKDYGIECRSLGAYFLSSAKLIEWVWEGIETCIQQLELGEDLNKDVMYIREDINEYSPIEDIINNYDVEAARLYCDENNINYLKEESCKTYLYTEA